jgi:toxin-antitoxin system PIN domain toxin
MISFDTNILLYSLNPASKWHGQAVEAMEQSLNEDRVVMTDYVLVELYNLLRNPTVMNKPLTAAAATKIVQQYLKHPAITRAENAPVMDEVWVMAAKPNFARRRIFDVRLGLTLRHHGVTRFATANVKDFQGLGFEQVWNPLLV